MEGNLKALVKSQKFIPKILSIIKAWSYPHLCCFYYISKYLHLFLPLILSLVWNIYLFERHLVWSVLFIGVKCFNINLNWHSRTISVPLWYLSHGNICAGYLLPMDYILAEILFCFIWTLKVSVQINFAN